jgi:hypothetical protein
MRGVRERWGQMAHRDRGWAALEEMRVRLEEVWEFGEAVGWVVSLP